MDSALSLLPHGPEFRFVDRILELDPGKRATAEFTVRGDESFLRGHFPGDPLFPGVLLIEAGAQLAGIVAQSDSAIVPLKNLKLTAVRNAKILGTARPGEILRITCELEARFANLVQAHVTVAIAGKIIFEGNVALSGDA